VYSAKQRNYGAVLIPQTKGDITEVKENKTKPSKKPFENEKHALVLIL
jgi:hypothetical protein